MADDEYDLTCLIEGDKSTFSVLAPRTASVSVLRRLIRQEGELDRFNFRVLDLTLLKVEIDLKPLLGRISQFKLNSRLHHSVTLDDSSFPLSELWEEQPPARHIHIFVRLPSRDADQGQLLPSFQRLHLASLSAARTAPAPSSVAGSVGTYKRAQDRHPIYNGRPFERRGPPVILYNESLAKLKDELSNLEKTPEPSPSHIALTAELFHAAATIYDTETQRGDAIYGYIRRLLRTSLDRSVRVTERSNKTITEADAVVFGAIENQNIREKAVVAYVEFENELGMRGEGGLQAALSLRKYVARDDYDDIRNASCCPCVIISLAGPFLLIAGAVFVEVFTVQNFTGYVYMGGDPFETKQVYYVAKVFGAVARAVSALQREYFFLRPQSDPEFRLPSPTYLPGSPFAGSLVFEDRFMYEGGYPDSYRRSLFRAEYEGKAVVVKFCERYSEAAHELLSDVGLAPTLHYCSLVVGGVFMVVMDLVEGREAYSQFGYRDLPQTVLDDVKRALGILHDAKLVYGDMRRPNIMVVKKPISRDDDTEKEDSGEWRGLLVDFDWSGHVGEVKYPPTLNTSGEIKWAEGVEPGTEIEQKHDLDMLRMITDGTDR